LNDELRATFELGQTAKAILSKKDRFKTLKVMTGGASQKEKLMAFFRAAYMPRQIAAQDQLLRQVLILMNTKYDTGVGFLNFNPVVAGQKAQVQRDLNNGLLDFAKRIVDNMELRHGDGDDRARRTILNAHERMATAAEKSSSGKKVMLLTGILFVVLFGGQMMLFGKMSDALPGNASDDSLANRSLECRGLPSDMVRSCDAFCRAMSCEEVCSDSAPWACGLGERWSEK